MVVSAYVPEWPPAAALKAIGLRTVSDAQIYLDLLKTGLRGPDQAVALRHWEGFCRP